MSTMQLPDFLVIGAEKSGTTWLKHNLNEHPEVFVPSKKELNFFDKDEHYDQGLSYYASFFEQADGNVKKGELTPGYLHTPEKSAARIYELFPQIKLIAILRDPVERAWSNFLMHKADGRTDASFADIISQNHSIVTKGYYYQQLLPYLNRFPSENIMILNYDRLKSEPAALLKQIFSFIGVDDNFVPTQSKKVIFSARKAKYPVLNKTLSIVGHVSRSLGFAGKFRGAKRKLRQWVKKNNTVTAPKEAMSESDRRALNNLYREDLDQLSGLVGKDFSNWI
ncbi:sulfotransferase [Roseivirga sp. BDSF3-8]|uniref:sulfotransferase family protein n=1 Tax=Roseivirga sp. BDSF3-8 TaxID=3241598 RepID=UPI003531F351